MFGNTASSETELSTRSDCGPLMLQQRQVRPLSISVGRSVVILQQRQVRPLTMSVGRSVVMLQQRQVRPLTMSVGRSVVMLQQRQVRPLTMSVGRSVVMLQQRQVRPLLTASRGGSMVQLCTVDHQVLGALTGVHCFMLALCLCTSRLCKSACERQWLLQAAGETWRF